MTIQNRDIFETLTETDEEAITGGVLVYAPGNDGNGIQPDGNPSTPPGNSGVTVPTEINRLNPQGKPRGFASTQSPGIIKNGTEYDFNPVTGEFTRT